MHAQIKQSKQHKSVMVYIFVLLLTAVALFGGWSSANVLAEADAPQVIGGQESQPGVWPWMAALVYAPMSNAYYGQFCGATLVAPEWVLTAAHCTHNLAPNQIDVVLGRHNLTTDEGERIAVREIITHPDYDEDTLDSDLALLHLVRPSVQQPIHVATPEMVQNIIYPGSMATVTGWGNTNIANPVYPETLQEAQLPVVEHDFCNGPQVYNGVVTLNMLCAGYDQGGEDSCKGDSGGPLMIPQDDGTSWVQIGIVSWGEGCAQAYRYGVYTQLANFTTWLDSYILAPPVTPQVWLPFVTGS